MSQRHRLGATAIIVLALSLVLLGPAGGAAAQAPTGRASALAWLRGQQAADGSFGGSVGNTIEVTLAAAAAGEDLSTWRAPDGPSVVDYIVAQADQYAVEAATTGKLVTAVAAAGLDPTGVGGVDLVQRLRGYDDGEGAFAPTALAQAWAMVGLAAAGGPIPQGAAPALIALQQADGAWEGGTGWGSDSNTTALAVQALVAAGVPVADPALTRARDYLQEQLAPDGGFVYSAEWGDAPDANSTAYGIQGLLALGQDPEDPAWTRSGRTPLDALLAFQIEGGAFEWQEGEGANLLATAQAVPALARVTYPLRRAEIPAPDPIVLEDDRPLSGTLLGRRAGAYALYRLVHPGGGRAVTVEVSTPAEHPLVLIGFGFNVYDEDGERLGGGSVAATTPQQVLRFTGTADSPAEWTVQVYNYIEGAALPYSIAATGLDAVPSDSVPTAEVPAQQQPAAPSEGAPPVVDLDDVVRGELLGEGAGAYTRYRFQVPSAGEDLTVRLRFGPDDPSARAALGFTIYAPSGTAVSGAPTGVPGERLAGIAAADAGEYLVQVHNYAAGVSMSYTLSR